MNCPFCFHQNLQGADECERCGEDLTAFDRTPPKDRFEKSLLKDSLGSLKGLGAVCVAPETPLQKVVEMLDQNRQPVLVVEQGKLVGIVTERDILFRVLGKKLDLNLTPVRKIMTSDPEVLEVSDKIVHALNKMAMGGFRHVPLLKEGRPESIVGVREVLDYLAELFPKSLRPRR